MAAPIRENSEMVARRGTIVYTKVVVQTVANVNGFDEDILSACRL